MLDKRTEKKYEKAKTLNDSIEVSDLSRAKYGYNISCRCKQCNHKWAVGLKQFVKNPKCPNCTPHYHPEVCTRYTTEEWIEKAKLAHPELIFDEKTVYKNNKTPITVKCGKHGYFTASPKEIVKKEYECAKCKREREFEERKKKVCEELIEKLPNGYEIDTSSYKGMKERVRIKCPFHGWFMKSPYAVLILGCFCPICGHENAARRKMISTDEFIKMAKTKRCDRDDDFSEVIYRGSYKPITLICHKLDKYGKEHGAYSVTPHAYLSGFQSCPKCVGKHRRTVDEFKEEADKIHNFKYDYSLITEDNFHEYYVEAICHEKDELGREHGIFKTSVKNHLNGYGCPKCAGRNVDLELLIYRFNKIHDFKYVYDRITEYKGIKSKVEIICPEHGLFVQQVGSHLQGRGCPFCKESHDERDISIILNRENIEYVKQKRFDWLINDKTDYKLPLDFYIEGKNIAIESQGEQHFISNFYKSKGIEYAEEHLKGVQYRDSCKKRLCKENGVHLIYYVDKKFERYMSSEDVYFTDKNELVEYIKNYEYKGIC